MGWWAPLAIAGADMLLNKGKKNTSTTTQQAPWYVNRAGEEAYNIAHEEAQRPYTPYGGQRIATLHPGFQEAYNYAAGATQADRRGIQQGKDVLSESMEYGRGNEYLDSLWGGKGFSTDTWGKEAMDQYMSPFIQGALDPVAEEMRRQYGIQKNVDQDQFKSSGAFGGEREAILEAEGRRNTQRAVGDMYATGYQQAYDQAFRGFTSDQARDLNMQKANATAAMGMHGQGVNSVGAYGNLVGLESDLATADVARLQGAAGPLQADAQAREDWKYQQFIEERDWAERAMKYYNQVNQMGGTTSTKQTGPGTSPVSQLAGAALTSYSLYDNAYGGGASKTNDVYRMPSFDYGSGGQSDPYTAYGGGTGVINYGDVKF